MASGSKTGLFNLALASLAAGASAFAIAAMPEAVFAAWIETLGLSWLIASPPSAAARLGVLAAVGVLAFVLSWLALRTCDQPLRRPATEIGEQADWPDFSQFGVDSSGLVPLRRALVSHEDTDDPFLALARGAERVEGPLELCREQIAPDAPVCIDDPDDDGLSVRELLDRIASPAPAPAGVSSLIQRLNAGLAESEWPVPSGPCEEAPADPDDRLRGVILDLKMMARRA